MARKSFGGTSHQRGEEKTNQKVVFDMHQELQQKICAQLSASGIGDIQLVQKLWGGYGELFRCALIGAKTKSIVVKYIRLSKVGDHPRGWNTKQSHERKLKSYQVETTWYNHLSKRCDDGCQIPRCLYQHKSDQEIVLVLEDLNEIGFPLVEHTIDWNRIETVLRWLANFHATFLGVSAARLWEVGTYWHLATRTDELNKLTDFPLKSAAQEIDLRLSNATHKTIVHGDAKLANFCFSRDGSAAAAVDFQYVGGGCGMKDVAYFIGSCLTERDCEKQESRILDFYFSCLSDALNRQGKGVFIDSIEREWRGLYHYAWADFHRFLKGWSPKHWKINKYSERITRQIVAQLS
ncbi:DUF1679 domain-containing protein [Flavobacteriales bacterium]|nr:DUF1679 domain-containing protein [Flavobacteriales bacterium]